MRLGKTALYHFLSQIVISVSGFVATFVIATILGSGDLGLYKVAVAVGFFWLAIPSHAVSNAIKKRMSEGEEPGAYLAGGVLLNGFIAAGMGALVLAASLLLQAVDAPEVVFVEVLVTYDLEIALLTVGATALKTTLSALEGTKRVATAGGLKAVDRVTRSVVQIALIASGFGVMAITLGHAGTLLFVTALGAILLAQGPTLPSKRHLHSLVDYAQYAWLGSLRGRVFGWLDVLVLSLFLGSASLIGVYEVAWGIGSLLATAGTSISSTLFPEVSDLSTDGRIERITHYLDEALAYSGIIVIPGLFGAAVVGDRVLRFYRPEFVQGEYVLLILIGAYVADVYGSQFLNVINAVDRPDAAFRINAVFIAANAVLNVVLVWQFGWYGAAVATALSAGVRAVAGYVVFASIAGEVSLPTRTVAAQVFAGGLMAVTVLAVRDVAPQGRLYTLLLVGLGATVYGVALLLVSRRVREKASYLLSTVGPGSAASGG